MIVVSVLASVAIVTAVVALVVAVRADRRLSATEADLEAANAALANERQATAHSIATVHQTTVDEVTGLLENHMTQVDTEIAARVAEALASQNPLDR